MLVVAVARFSDDDMSFYSLVMVIEMVEHWNLWNPMRMRNTIPCLS
jgi:hypothetical protein